ncbi:hypothetical protein BDU57DRAFT_521500 [Ampelomyces quisqualis]|uniref:Uncharacterized protein n=1 Tax=Ampelomyces quisqualis TaxID=50730 RepID=A0A6A5QDG7_AMPQU|nr:hypothetical protein BDU57DRAFT_521500 [Ampelomyces quisqualis]
MATHNAHLNARPENARRAGFVALCPLCLWRRWDGRVLALRRVAASLAVARGRATGRCGRWVLMNARLLAGCAGLGVRGEWVACAAGMWLGWRITVSWWRVGREVYKWHGRCAGWGSELGAVLCGCKSGGARCQYASASL